MAQVVVEPAYNVQAGLAAIAGLEAYQATAGGTTLLLPLAGFTGILAAFLTLQATRVRCQGLRGVHLHRQGVPVRLPAQVPAGAKTKRAKLVPRPAGAGGTLCATHPFMLPTPSL